MSKKAKKEVEVLTPDDPFTELAVFLARGIMLVGDEVKDKAYRLQFMLGYHNNEKPAGGLSEYALAVTIATLLRSHAKFTERVANETQKPVDEDL